MNRRIARMAPGLVLVLGLVLAGCGDDGTTTSSPTTAETSPSVLQATTSTAPGTTAVAGADVNVETSSLGQILVDAEGMTLYVFMNDTAGTTTCVDACAQTWPPLVATSVAVGPGLTAGDFTLVARPDGTQQLAVAGHPLYRFAGDTAAGETSGQGFNGLWYVVGPDGTPIDND